MNEAIHRRTVIEIEPVWTVPDFEEKFRVKIWQPLPDGWPRKKDKPTAVIGSEASEEAALEQIRLWFQEGCPNTEEMNRRIEAENQ